LPLYEEHTVLVARVGHPLARKKISKKVLATLRHVEVHVAPGRGSRPLARTYAELGVARDIAIVVPTFAAAAAPVAATDYVTSLPASLVGVLGPRLGLRTVATPLPPLAVTINLLWHERTHEDPAMRAFRDLLVRAGSTKVASARRSS